MYLEVGKAAGFPRGRGTTERMFSSMNGGDIDTQWFDSEQAALCENNVVKKLDEVLLCRSSLMSQDMVGDFRRRVFFL
jgi:hypothetical protein